MKQALERNGPWIVRRRTQVYKNQWMELVEDDVIQPNGGASIFSVLLMKAGVGVVALDSKNTVYLVRDFHYALGREGVEVVCGGMDAGETPLHAAKRELKEELGITARLWTHLGRYHLFTTAIDSPMDFYLARTLSFGKSNPDSTERITMVSMPLNKALACVMDGRIDHGASSLLLLKVAIYLRKQSRGRASV